MAISTTVLDNRFTNKTIKDTDTDETATVDITGASGSVYYVQISAGGTSAVNYFKIYDTNGVVVGTSDPIFQIKVPASTTKECVISGGMPFTTALSFATVTAGGTAGTTGPSGATVTATIITS
tara:strand:+ start:2025 stop:2393 length:369 start_codon:yes stop_codon:yes gene_type:complete